MDLSGGPGCVSELHKLKEPMRIGNEEVKWFSIMNYSFDPFTICQPISAFSKFIVES